MKMKHRPEIDAVCNNFIKNTMDFYDIPGIAVGVCILNDEMPEEPYIFTGAGGYGNYETKEPVLPETVFHCTSVSKLFTAIGIIKLVEKGKLKLSDHLADVLPYLSIADERWVNVTIEHMLTHTSGFTDVGDYGWKYHQIDEEALKRYAMSDEVIGKKLLWIPGEGFRYSSMAYDLLGLVIAEVSDVSFEDFIEREIFEPLTMKNTTFKTYERTDGDLSLQAIDEVKLAMPHYKGRDRVIRLEDAYPYTRQHAPSSTLTSTAGDILKWASAIMRRAPLQEKTIKDMWVPRVGVPDTGEKMGLGWFVRKQELSPDGEAREFTLVGHEGSDDGFRTSFWMCPELGIATVLLCNMTDAPLKKLNKQLLKTIVEK